MKSSILLLSLIVSFNSFAKIISFFPQGYVKDLKQIIVRFDSDMIAMGDAKVATDIFDIKCFGGTKEKVIPLPKNTTRWADTKSWVMDFENPMASGINCEFNLKYDISDYNNKRVANDSKYYLTTGGLRLVNHYPTGQIDNLQYFLIEFDGEVDQKSIIEKTYFEIEGISEKTKIKIISGKERNDVLDYILDRGYVWEYRALRREEEKLKGKPELLKKYREENYKNILIIGSTKKFPDGANVALKFDKGLLSSSQVPTDVENILKFNVIAPFNVEFSCGRTNIDEACHPIENMSLYFNYPVKALDLKDVKIVSSKGITWSANEFKGDSRKKYNSDSELSSLSFIGPFPEKENFKVILPKNLKDSIDRNLTNQNKFPLSIKTTEYTPLIKFPARFGIIEWDKTSALPFSVRNIEKKIMFKQDSIIGKTLNLNSLNDITRIIKAYEDIQELNEWPSVENDPRNIPYLKKNEGKQFFVPKPSGESEFEMMGIGLTEPGFYLVEVESPRLGASLTTTKKPMYVQTTALVTNMAIHFKRGEESGLVFLTHLNDSSPVPNADVSVRDCNGVELYKGKTAVDGTLKINAKVGAGLYYSKNKSKQGYSCIGLYVFAKKDQDFTFVNTNWEKGIESYRYGVNQKYMYDEHSFKDGIYHTLLDRTLFKPGETVSMQHYFREHHQEGFQYLNKSKWPLYVYIQHSSSEKVFTIPLKVNPKTSDAITTFKIPADAPYGSYEIYLSRKSPKKPKKGAEEDEENNYSSNLRYDNNSIYTGNFTVTDYRLPMMQGNVKILGDEFIRSHKLEADLSANYLSGGPAKDLKISVRKQVQDGFQMPNFLGSDDYSFYSEKMKIGIINRDEENDVDTSKELQSKELKLDQNGGLRTEFSIDKDYDLPKRFYVEMEYADPNGEIKVVNNYKTIYPSEYVIGLKLDSWITTPDLTKLDGVIVDLKNNPKANIAFKVRAIKNEYYSHRKRLVGGFYSYDSTEENKDLGVVCEGKSDNDGHFHCDLKNLPAGYIYLQAEVEDSNKNAVYSRVSVDVLESGVDRWMTASDSDRIDILPAKKEGTPNEKLKLLIKTPFKEATALITVEREGVLDHYVTTLKRDNPVFELPIKANYAPNVFISAVLVRGRIAEKREDFLVDLNRPAVKMGLIPLKVGWKGHLLNVNVTSDKKRYLPRESANITVKLKRADGQNLAPGSKVTLIAFDEALTLLKKNDTFDILQSMMMERPLAVSTSSGQTQVIGRRHFGSKAKNPGGDGGLGDGSSRELFDTLLAFIPNLEVGADGTVTTKIKINDSMTSFKVVAVATNGENLFGYGKTEFVASKDIIVYSGAAPLVHQGDKIFNKYTVRNTTKDEMKVVLNYSAKEISDLKVNNEFSLAPSESKVFTFETNIPSNIKELNLEAKAQDSLSKAEDGIKTKVKVEKSLTDYPTMATLFQLEKPEEIKVKEGENSVPGSGGISVYLNKTMLNSLSTLKSYMEEYPYSCLEQQTSKAVVLEDKKALEKIAKNIPSYMDQDGLLKYFPTEYSCGSAHLTTYILQMYKENNVKMSEITQNKLLDGLNRWMNGRILCRVWWFDFLDKKYFDQEKISVLRTMSDFKRFDVKDFNTVKIDQDNWSVETNLNLRRILLNETNIPNRNDLLLKVDNNLRSKLTFNGTNLVLQSKRNRSYDYALFSSSNEEAIIFFNEYMDDINMKNDTGRLAKGITTLMKRGVFDSTMSNAWATVAYRKFSEKFEKTPITGKTEVQFGESVKSVEWNNENKFNKVNFEWKSDSKDKAYPVLVSMKGTGKPWVTLQTRSAQVLKAPLDLGYLVTKKIDFVKQKTNGKYSVGDVLNITLNIKANSDQHWIAMFDPIVAGASHLGNDLEGESQILDRNIAPKAGSQNIFPEEYSEKKFNGIYAYAAYLPAGEYSFNYRIRLNSKGKFKLPNTRVHAMYDQEIFGESPNEEITVED